MPTIKGIASFPTLFTPKVAKGATEAKYSISLLFPPGDPELNRLWAEYQQVLKEAYPSGLPRQADTCLMNYREKYEGKEYYDPKLADWWVFSCTAKAEDKPAVVGMDRQPIMDPGAVVAGMIVYVNAGMSAYSKGTGGIGGWLNGVMVTGELGQLGRLDNKPSVDQMFSDVPAAGPGYSAPPAPTPGASAPTPGASAPTPAPTAPVAAPTPPAPPAAPAAPAVPQKRMTAKAGGATYESFIANGWTDAAMIEQGYMELANGVTLSFAG